MKKKILTQLFVLSFAVAGFFLVGNNVFGGDPIRLSLMNLIMKVEELPVINMQNLED